MWWKVQVPVAQSWRIDGPVPEPILPSTRAIRYVMKGRRTRKDAHHREDADRNARAWKHIAKQYGGRRIFCHLGGAYTYHSGA